ncbi:MAG TPA: flagella basal body P-ring formation protein FlgA [Holosporales bacterium]|nr:flagella basal body P-ring formation protein FlgA [Holosporales bacterium]
MIFFLFVLTVFSHPLGALTLKEIVSTQKERAAKKAEPSPHQKETPFVAPTSSVPKGEKSSPFSSFTQKDVEIKVQDEIQKSYGDNIAVKFVSWHLPRQKFKDVSQFIVEAIEVNEQRTKIAALVHFQIKGVLKTLKIRGRLEHMIDVPTLNRPVHYGETITKNDLSWTKVPGYKSNRFLITTPEDLIGHQPRSGFLKINVPLYQRDVERVKDIEKGSMVTVLYKTDKLELVTKARALEHGYKGDTIRILNQDTNKILQGAVIDVNTISLTPYYKQDNQ